MSMNVFKNSLRLSWDGGAKQMAIDAVLPIFILPIMFLLASISFWWTIFCFTAITVIVLSLFRFFIYTMPRTKFFLVWTITSVVILYVIFEFIVIPFLQILVEENIILSLFIGGFALCLYFVKIKTYQLQNFAECEIERGNSINRPLSRCSICQIIVPDKDHHFVWFDSCVGHHNQCVFILSLVFAIAALVYSSNLTLTTVCHPFVFYKTILLPDDCSDVYQQFELGLSFVAALYSLGLAIILLITLGHQLLLVSIGLSSKDWKNLSCIAKCFLGLFSKRPHSLGFIKNWCRVICWKRN